MIKFENLPFKKEQVFLVSDTHYGHGNIVKGTSSWDNLDSCRDFDTVEEMNNALVQNINDIVKEDDLLIHHGDWSFGGRENIVKFRERINCKNIILIRGNHDHNVYHFRNLFMEIMDMGYFQVENVKFVSCHYPIAVWHQHHKGVLHFYGHVHSSYNNVGKSIDVGVDNSFKLFGRYEPFSLRKAESILSSLDTHTLSHHDKNTN